MCIGEIRYHTMRGAMKVAGGGKSMTPRTATPFWDRVDRSSPDGCWPWLGCRNEDGYGEVRYQGEMDKAHRIAWELYS